MNILYVFLGAGIGGILRYWIILLANKINCQLPLGTITVNMLGCFFAGIVLFFVLSDFFSQTVSIFFIVGILGGFTTFSAFSIETFMFFQKGQMFLMLCNILISFGNIFMTYLGYLFTQKMFNLLN